MKNCASRYPKGPRLEEVKRLFAKYGLKIGKQKKSALCDRLRDYEDDMPLKQKSKKGLKYCASRPSKGPSMQVVLKLAKKHGIRVTKKQGSKYVKKRKSELCQALSLVKGKVSLRYSHKKKSCSRKRKPKSRGSCKRKKYSRSRTVSCPRSRKKKSSMRGLLEDIEKRAKQLKKEVADAYPAPSGSNKQGKVAPLPFFVADKYINPALMG